MIEQRVIDLTEQRDMAYAAYKWLRERGYDVRFNGDYYVVWELGFSAKDDAPTNVMHKHRAVAYQRAFDMAAKDGKR